MRNWSADRIRPLFHRWRALLLLMLFAVTLGGCAVESVKTQAFSRIDRFKSEIKRGVSTKADVLLLLGEPDGTGALGGFEDLRDTAHKGKGPVSGWYYESIGGLMTQNQNVLLVLFMGDGFDGYFWFANKIEGGML